MFHNVAKALFFNLTGPLHTYYGFWFWVLMGFPCMPTFACLSLDVFLLLFLWLFLHLVIWSYSALIFSIYLTVFYFIIIPQLPVGFFK